MLRKFTLTAAVLALFAGLAYAATNEFITGNVTVGGTVTAAGVSSTAATTITSASANALAVGPNGTTNPSLNVDASTTSAATGLNVKSAAAGAGLAVSVTSSGSNENISVAGKGTGIALLGQAICTASGTTPQTCNGQRGIVTTGSLSTAAATSASFTINDSSVTSSSLVLCYVNAYSGTISTNGNPIIENCIPGSGSIVASIRNVNAANALSGTVGIGFVVLN